MVNNQRLLALCTQSGFDLENSQKDPKVSYNFSFDMDKMANKVSALGAGTAYDVCASTSSRRVASEGSLGIVLKSGICHAFTPDGRCVSLFKTLYTNACTHSCNYCPNATSCKMRKSVYKYTPTELANITIELYKRNYIEGLFLSSAVAKNESRTTEEMLQTLEILRKKYNFGGYIHMKILPGVQKDYIKQAVELADRVSINIEASSKSRLSEMSQTKHYKNDIIQRQKYIRDEVNKINSSSGHTTQMIIGSTDETDTEIFNSMQYEYKSMSTRRVYYSAFSPVCGTTFEKISAQSLWRENRLYQLDWLYRIYKLKPNMLKFAFDDYGYLPNSDPKIAIAKNFLDRPIDPQYAQLEDLVLIPGIGIKSANRIIQTRKIQKLDSKQKLADLGVVLKRAIPYLKIAGLWQTGMNRWLS